MSTPSRWFETFVFGFRFPILVVMALLTVFFAYEMYDLRMDTNLKKMVPLAHPYIQNFFKHKDELHLGNDLRVAIENREGDIFDADFLEAVRAISDEAFYLPGVDKGRMKSLWTPNVRWSEVDTEGIRGGEIIPPTYDGSAAAVEMVRQNVMKSDLIGNLVSDDLRSTIIYLPLIDSNDDSAEGAHRIDYALLASQIETSIRDRFAGPNISIHIIGFAKKVGDLIDAITGVMLFFLAMLLITFHLLVFDSRCVRSAGAILVGAIMAVIWQLGIVTLMRKGMIDLRSTELWTDLITRFPTLEPIQFGLDPYSMLVPFLVFAIAISHGVQYSNEMTLKMTQGEDAFDAARSTFRALFIPGLLALLSDAVGFVTLWFIDIGVIRELAITASIGVAVIVVTKLIFVPIVLSYSGIGPRGVAHRQQQSQKQRTWRLISRVLELKPALVSLVLAALLAGTGLWIRQDLKIGDLDAGAPELHPDSRYNQDNAFITEHFSVSADVLVVMAESTPGTCSSYAVLSRLDRFVGRMEDVEGVDAVISLASVSKHITTGFNEGSLKWATLPPAPAALNGTMIYLPEGLMNVNCSLVPVYIFLQDHKAETLERAVQAVEQYPAAEADAPYVRYTLASGTAGVEAATNQTIKAAESRILWMVYGVVSVMVWLAFRSWRAVVCIIVPLLITSILCESLMVMLHIGVKVATLPVIALGVGIGVDYGIYLFAKMRTYLQQGESLDDAYLHALRTTGRSVVFTCITLSLSVGFWMFSHIKFQADMGILLTFMFLWNMVGALWLMPVLARFLHIKQIYTESSVAGSSPRQLA